MINIEVVKNRRLLNIDKKKLAEILAHTLKSENINKGDISIIFVDKAHILKLKKQFFGIKKATDVIAFRLNNCAEINVEGEIYICASIAKENAQYYQVSFENEIARLIIHGGLHILGYRDGTKAERGLMHQIENKYLKELGY